MTVVFIEFCDLIFAFDSIPAVFSVSLDPFVVFFPNIFAILGRASALLKRAGMKDQADEMFQRVTASGSYEQALNIISEYVETELTPPPIHQKSNKKKARDAHER